MAATWSSRATGLAGLFDFDFVSRGPRSIRRSARHLQLRPRTPRFDQRSARSSAERSSTGSRISQPLTGRGARSLPFMAVLNWVPDGAVDAWPTESPSDAGDTSRLQHAVRMMRVVQAEFLRLAPAQPGLGRRMRTGIGYDIHPLVEGRALVLGGVTISFEQASPATATATCSRTPSSMRCSARPRSATSARTSPGRRPFRGREQPRTPA